jgi:hypothetical protein
MHSKNVLPIYGLPPVFTCFWIVHPYKISAGNLVKKNSFNFVKVNKSFQTAFFKCDWNNRINTFIECNMYFLKNMCSLSELK